MPARGAPPDSAQIDGTSADVMVTQEVKRNVKVSLSPSVKFMEVEAEAGGLEFGFEYTALE